MSNNIQNLQPDRPKIITADMNFELTKFQQGMDIFVAVESLIEGKNILVDDFYYTGLEVLKELKNQLKHKFNNENFKEEREFRSTFRDASHRLLLYVENNKLAVQKSPDIGWLEILYPDVSQFLISFPETQGLNSSWQWYQKGIKINVLKLTLHPYFGTYFPTRFDHLQLFEKWLKKYKGAKKNSIEIGIGSGVLSFQLLKNGFKQIFATDNNKNAIIGVSHEAKRMGIENKLNLNYGDLFADCDFQTELIIFNPPWIIAEHELNGIDKAIYYNQELFPNFFEKAKKHLCKDGKLVLLFSNLAQVVGTDDIHPIRQELEKRNRFKKVSFIEKSVKASSKKTKRTDWRKNEKVELWVLEHR